MKKFNWSFIVIGLLSGIIMGGCNNKEILPPQPPTINITDSLVMVDFYHAMKLGEWGNSYNWDLTDPNTWNGVKFLVDENGLKYVTSISIVSGKDVECSLPSNLGELKHLTLFRLGDIPNLNDTLPESIYNCPISSIVIANCPKLTGKISPKIAQWKNSLIELTISRTSFYGEIPKEIGECYLLGYLSLTKNQFSGIIPSEIANIPCDIIYLNYNEFTGIDWTLYIEDIGSADLTAAFNNFTGEIPQEVLESKRWNNSFHSFYPFNKGYGFTNYPLDDTQIPK